MYIVILVRKWKSFYKDTLFKIKNISGSNANLIELKKIGITSKYIPYPWPIQNKVFYSKKNKHPSFLFFWKFKWIGIKISNQLSI